MSDFVRSAFTLGGCIGAYTFVVSAIEYLAG
jgi:hypothetical protein